MSTHTECCSLTLNDRQALQSLKCLRFFTQSFFHFYHVFFHIPLSVLLFFSLLRPVKLTFPDRRLFFIYKILSSAISE